MITLDNFEDFVPYKIWMRGEEYYETDAVSELEEISPGEWTATVEGTDDYNVEISMDGNEIESWYFLEDENQSGGNPCFGGNKRSG